jgi:hypothetical protein
MRVTENAENIIVELTKAEAIAIRQWIDDNQNSYESEADQLVDNLADELFDLTYTPRTE